MALFILKPIIWNTEGYRRPSGVAVNVNSFPGQHGFGHEEWNGSEALRFEDNGVAYRAFHTEGVGNAPVEENAGKTFVFLYASHDGVQELVGIAGNATCLIDQLGKRQALTKRLQLEKLGNQAWSVPRVKTLHKDDRSSFVKVWKADLPWIPNWICPEEMFLWLDEPVTLRPTDIRGTTKLLTMFSRYTEIDRETAVRLLDYTPLKLRTLAWRRLETEIKD